MILNKCLFLFLVNAPGEKAVCIGQALSSKEDSLAVAFSQYWSVIAECQAMGIRDSEGTHFIIIDMNDW